jgi:hypothetical protein
MQFLCQQKRMTAKTQDRYCAPRKGTQGAEMDEFFASSDAPEKSNSAPL